MHLAIEVPNTWYRASWSWWDGDGGARRVTGVTLPGMPVLVVGSTGRVAWGFSNSFVDVTDLVDLELDPRDPEQYRTPAGPRRFEHHGERIRVRGGRDVTLDAQRLLFAHSKHGDLTPYFDGFHDTSTGPKLERSSYLAIASAFALPPEDLLFLSDTAGELDAAAAAGYRTGLLERPGNRPQPSGAHPAYGSLAELAPARPAAGKVSP
jgi:penicillin amidase